MRTVGALRDAQRENRRKRRAMVRHLLAFHPAMTLSEAYATDEIQQLDREWQRLDQQAELNKVPGDRRNSR